MQQIVQTNINKLIETLQPQLEFLNAPMVSFITKDLFKSFIPENVRNEMNDIRSAESSLNFFFNHEAPEGEDALLQHKHLNHLIQQTKALHLDQLEDKLYLNVDELKVEFEKLGLATKSILNESGIKIHDFLSVKKFHEVTICSELVAAMADPEKHLIIDIGDGKGYLSSRLALEYKFSVLGIDGNPSNTERATKRNEKLKKNWKGIVNREAGRNNVKIDNEFEVNSCNYKTVSEMIYEHSELTPLVQEMFGDTDANKAYLLTGLHTCGNLTPSMLKLFVKNNQIKSIFNVGCCPNLMTEQFENDQSNPGGCFPMSLYLKEKKYKLGQNARMLGSQAFARVLNDKKLPSLSLFYRALFEKFYRSQSHGIPHNEVLKIRKIKFTDIQDYFKQAADKVGITITTTKIAELAADSELIEKHLNLYYFIRLLYSPIIEALIILDRYLFLLEHAIESVFLVKLFDPVVSPRNYCIIAVKK
ncbi:unnamed protein product [Diamesa serratosioi]